MTPLKHQSNQPIVSLCYFIIYIIFILFFNALPIPSLIGWSNELAQQKTSHMANSVFLFINIIVAIIGFILFYQRFREDGRYMMAHKKQAMIWILVYILFFFVFACIPFPTLISEGEMTIFNMSFTLSTMQIPFYLLVLILTGPLVDVILYEEIIINQLSSYLPKYVLAVLSALLYAIGHVSMINLWYQAIPYFLNLLITNILYIRSNGNLWYILISQVIFNAAFIMILM